MTAVAKDTSITDLLQQLKEQLDDLYEGQEGIKDQLREINIALDLLSEEDEDEGGWG